MSVFKEIAQGGLSGLADGVGKMARGIREAITGKEVQSSEERQALIEQARELERLSHEMNMAALNTEKDVALQQIELLKTDAAKPGWLGLLQSGWRPMVGYVCATALGYHFLVRDFLVWVATWRGWQIPPPPTLQMDQLMTLVIGMLGLGTMRTVEKIRR